MLLLITYEPKRKRFFKDPKDVCGIEKTQLLNSLTKFIDDYKHIENPDKLDKENYYNVCVLLENEACRRAKQATAAEYYYNQEKHKMINEALEEFKVQAKLTFMEKYGENVINKIFTPDMMRDLDKLEKREKASCYLVNGITISERDCNVCSHHACNRNQV